MQADGVTTANGTAMQFGAARDRRQSASCIDPATLRCVHDFVDQVRTGDHDEVDRRLHRGHPLVTLIEQTLTTVALHCFNVRLGRLDRASKGRVTIERRKLEDAAQRPMLQRFLFSFDEIADLVQASSYNSTSAEDNVHFFVEIMPDWLADLRTWAIEDSCEHLAAAVSEAFRAYIAVAADVAVLE